MYELIIKRNLSDVNTSAIITCRISDCIMMSNIDF